MAAKKASSSYTFSGENLMSKLKTIIAEGNVRRIIVKDAKGKSIAEFSLTVGVVGTVIAPVLAAVGAIAALLSDCSITVEK